MKIKIIPILLVSLLLTSCVKEGEAGIDEKATEAMRDLCKELSEDGTTSYKVKTLEVVFSNDSLCIIQADILGKNTDKVEATIKIEYVYLISYGIAYEALCLDGEGFYISESDYDKRKESSIYEELEYPQGLYYLASLKLNSIGRVVGVKNSHNEVQIPSLTGTGDWRLGTFVDDFGDVTNENYLVLFGEGVFSNSATSNSSLTGSISVTEDKFWFTLAEYGNQIVKNGKICDVKIKDSKGIVHDEWLMCNSKSDGKITQVLKDKYNDELKQILTEEGTITVAIKIGVDRISNYKFTLNLDGYNRALNFLK